MFETLIISPLAILLSICTSTGILLHETKVDKLAALTIMTPMTARQVVEHAGAALESMPHTHVESASLESASSQLKTSNPSTTPRKDDKKYRLQKRVARGFHVFDAYYLPLES